MEPTLLTSGRTNNPKYDPTLIVNEEKYPLIVQRFTNLTTYDKYQNTKLDTLRIQKLVYQNKLIVLRSESNPKTKESLYVQTKTMS